MPNSLFTLLLTVMTGLCLSVCIHDSVQKDTHVVSPQFLPSKTPRILPRSSPLSLFMPLRITPWYMPGDSAVTTPQISAQLQAAMAEVTNIISSMLSVRTSESPLLLSRDISRYCRSVWRDPSLRNYNRCGSLDVSYSGESCLDVMIPDSHLQGFAIWPANGNKPIQMIPDGTGVPDTDFLLYVRVAQTIKCAAQPSVIAYASFCQLDSSGRPIAGVIVFCMERLKEGDYQHSHIVQASLHELLHALGFSNSLFEYWTDCSFSEPGGACSSRSRVSNTDEHGQFRIYTPTVTQKMGEHFGEANVGAPLENKDFPSSPSSHWESRILQGSILTASLSPPHLSLLDPITLAAFTDMGWYEVNTSFKGQLAWGRDAGPSFGQPSTCHDSFSDFFCTGSEIGCHHLHLDKGICTTDAFLDGCRIYKPLPKGGECWLERNGGEPDEIYHAQSRCFFSNITKTPPYQKITGRCYLHQCLASNTFQVKVQGSDWMDCPSGQWVQVAGFEGFLKCPSDRLCMGFPDPPAKSPTAGSSTIHSEATREVNITSNQSMEVRVQVTLTQSLEGSTEKIMLLLDEVLDVISQVAEVQRCLLHVPSQIDLGSSFTLTIRSSPNCPSPAVESPFNLKLLNLSQPGTAPIKFNSSHFYMVSIRFMDADSPASLQGNGIAGSVAGGSLCILLAIAFTFTLAWRKHCTHSRRVGNIYETQRTCTEQMKNSSTVNSETKEV